MAFEIWTVTLASRPSAFAEMATIHLNAMCGFLYMYGSMSVPDDRSEVSKVVRDVLKLAGNSLDVLRGRAIEASGNRTAGAQEFWADLDAGGMFLRGIVLPD